MKPIWIALVLAFAASLPASAGCDKLAGQWLPLKPNGGTYLVAVTVGGKERQFTLAMGSGDPNLHWNIVKEMQLPTAPSDKAWYVDLSDVMQHNKNRQVGVPTAVVPRIEIGPAVTENVLFFVRNNQWLTTDGVTSNALFAGHDVVVDLGHHKLGVFRHGACPVTSYVSASAPLDEFDYDPRQASLRAELDGKRFAADTWRGGTNSSIDMDAARSVFKISPDDPELTLVTTTPIGPIRRYPFKTLSFGQTTIANPDVLITGDSYWCRNSFSGCNCDNRCVVVLGSNDLEQLILIYDIVDSKIYVTSAGMSLNTGPATPAR